MKNFEYRNIQIIDVSKPNGVIIDRLSPFDKPIKQALGERKAKNYLRNSVNNLNIFIN